MAEQTKIATLTHRVGIWIVALAPLLYFYFIRHVDKDVIILGAASWGFGVGLKLVLYHFIVTPLHSRLSENRVAAMNGLVSGVAEMSAALVLLMYLKTLTLDSVLAFGLAAGSIEALVVVSVPNLLSGTPLQEGVTKLERLISELPAARRFLFEGIIPIIERFFASIIHLATRGLVYVGLASGLWPLCFLSLGPFIVLDGLVTYRLLMNAESADLRGMMRAYYWMAALSLSVLATFVVLWFAILN